VTGCQGCTVCRLRESGQLGAAEQLRSAPNWLHVEVEAELGRRIALLVLDRTTLNPLPLLLDACRSLLQRGRFGHDLARCFSRQLLNTEQCPLRHAQQWPTIITPADPGPAA
jgi:hypothetical protein